VEEPEVDGRLRLELFVHDVGRSVEFYRRVLGFEVVAASGGNDEQDYVAIRLGDAVIGLARAEILPDDHPVARHDGTPAGRGVEIVLEVHDVDAAFERAQRSGVARSSPLTAQAWGLVDFRVVDPDGYYLRVTGR
jgi:lactoylglutathione lyase